MSQEQIFLRGEGDAWFKRNKSAFEDIKRIQADPILCMLERRSLTPRQVAEIGASNGYRLGEIARRYRSRCLAIEPSLEAIKDGMSRYPEIEFRQGLAHDLPVAQNELFDLVIVNFVFHWIGREVLVKAVAEVDRLIVDNGYLIIGDFLPDIPCKVRYHHLSDKNVFTFKQDYAEVFVATKIYRELERVTYEHTQPDSQMPSDGNRRCFVSCLQKTLDHNYRAADLSK